MGVIDVGLGAGLSPTEGEAGVLVAVASGPVVGAPSFDLQAAAAETVRSNATTCSFRMAEEATTPQTGHLE